jgi:hypothetical protein
LASLVLPICLALAGCIFGYVSPAPDGFQGRFVLKVDAQLSSCDLGPGIWSGSTRGTCIGFRCYEDCVHIPTGTPIEVLHTFVHADGVRDVSVRVGTGSNEKVAHLYGTWENFSQYLARP